MHDARERIQGEIDRLAIEGKGMLAEAKHEGREFSGAEIQRFDTITKKLIPDLKAQLEQENNHLRHLVETARSYSRNTSQGQSNMYQHPSGIVYNQMNSGATDRVLPINGVLPGQQQPRYGKHVRVGKLRAFRDEQSAFDSGMWLKAIVAREWNHGSDTRAEGYCESIGLDITNASYETSGPAGGYLVPAPISSAIIDVKEMVGVSRKVCQVLPTSADTLTVPKRSGGLTVYAPGENNTITDSDKTWKQVECIVKKRAVASYLSNELNEDALINLTDNLFQEFGYALALQEDNELVNGTGAGATYFGVTGLLSSIGSAGVSTAASHTSWATLDMGDIMAFFGTLPDRFQQFNPSIICSFAFYNQVLARIAYTAGGVTAAEIMAGTANTRLFMGYPVYLTSQMPIATATATKCCLFGAFDQAVILADRGGVRVARSDEYKFLDDKITLRGTSRYDIKVHETGNSSVAGAYVALSTYS